MPETPPVYLIASPSLRTKEQGRWDRLVRELTALMPGAALVSYPDLPAEFNAVPRAERPARLARALGGAIIVPDKIHGRRLVGRMAIAEATAFTTAGKPVHVFVDRQLIPWAACHLDHSTDLPQRRPQAELIIPGRTPRTAWSV